MRRFIPGLPGQTVETIRQIPDRLPRALVLLLAPKAAKGQPTASASTMSAVSGLAEAPSKSPVWPAR